MNKRVIHVAFVFACGISAVGCSPLIDPTVPEPIRQRVEPQHGGEYLLYRPSGYDRKSAWPVVVVCHGNFPDNPNKQIRNWTEKGESHGFLVVAPSLTSSRSRTGSAEEQVQRLRADQRSILATIQHVRAGHNISDDRIFIYGWSTGSYAALYTGLRNPAIFRAVSVAQPKFSEGFLSEAGGVIDPHQPILVNYGVADSITGKHARNCLDWLRAHDARLFDDAVGSAKKNDTSASLGFFEEVIQKEPWLVLRAFPANDGNALSKQFKLRSSQTPARYIWSFGDGDTSPVAEPIHTYAAPGRYPLQLTVEGRDGSRHERKRTINVP